MTHAPFDVVPFLRQDEGQHFDRKSLFEGPPDAKKARDRRAVRDQVAEYVAAFANAEGGVLILGVEDDGTLTGHRYPKDALTAVIETPRHRCRPAQPEGVVVVHDGIELLVFEVPASSVPVMVEGDGFPLRMSDKTVHVSEKFIERTKLRGFVESWESHPSALRLEDLDCELLAQACSGAGFSARTEEDYLLARKLADRRGRDLVLRRAAELVFAQHGPDHPNAGVRIFRVIGGERRYGAEHNVEDRPRIEGNLPSVVAAAIEQITGLIRRPKRLLGNRFREVPEYPEFSWKEALLNAVAHRDYLTEGRTTEVWFFDDRLEVTSPGGLVADVDVEQLRARRRVHASRNPRIVRALVDLGLVRDQGEGIPRMFAEMEGLFLPEPTIEALAREFRVILLNTPTLTIEDKSFVSALGDEELSNVEFRALLEAHRHGRVENARLREISGLDTLAASKILRRLCDRELLRLHAAGSASYYELADRVRRDRASDERSGDRGELGAEPSPDRGELPAADDADRGELDADGPADRGELDAERADAEAAPSDSVRRLLAALGSRPRQDKLREAILRLTDTPRSAVQIARLLGIRDVAKLVERHLAPMSRDGLLIRSHPHTPTHPHQTYRVAQSPLGARDDETRGGE